MTPHLYEIRIAGSLPPEALVDYQQLTVWSEPSATLVRGLLPDQAALHGLLARLETFGAQVIEMRRLSGSVTMTGELLRGRGDQASRRRRALARAQMMKTSSAITMMDQDG